MEDGGQSSNARGSSILDNLRESVCKTGVVPEVDEVRRSEAGYIDAQIRGPRRLSRTQEPLVDLPNGPVVAIRRFSVGDDRLGRLGHLEIPRAGGFPERRRGGTVYPGRRHGLHRRPLPLPRPRSVEGAQEFKARR